MRSVFLTSLLILLYAAVYAQIDTAKMMLGDWFNNDGEEYNIDINQVIRFSRQHTNDSFYLQWTFKENNQLVRSGVYQKNESPIGFKIQPVKYYLTNRNSSIYFKRKSYRIITLNQDTLTIKRTE
jgi:hypothetical protein